MSACCRSRRQQTNRWLSACYKTCQYFSADVIYQSIKRDSTSRCYQPVTKRVRTFLLMNCWLSACYTNVSERLLLTVCSFDLFIDMSTMSTIECTYLMRARCLKYIIYILPYSTPPCRDGSKANGAWLQKIWNSGKSAVQTLAHGNSKNPSIERRYEEDIPKAY